jgi:hypothetical protein
LIPDRAPRRRLAAFAAAASLALSVLAVSPSLAQRPAEASSWVWRDPGSGRLLYRTTAVGDRIPDFSAVGYMAGGRALPEVDSIIPPARRLTVQPPHGDATRAIQSAIDTVASWPLTGDGFRGLVQLAPGTHEIAGQIRIEASGIVLRGSPDARLRATGTRQRGVVLVAGQASSLADADLAAGGRRDRFRGHIEIADTRSEVVDDYVPVGAASLRVREPLRFTTGSEVIVFRPATAAWVQAIGMDRMPAGSNPDGRKASPWRSGPPYDQHYERRVTRVEGDRLFLDAPLPNSLDRRLGSAYVYRYTFPERIEQVGLIELHGESSYDPSIRDDHGREVDENHAWSFISVGRARNVWVDSVSARHFGYSTVILNRQVAQVTVRHAASHAPVSLIAGSRRYAFTNNGQRNLMQDLYSEQGRHDFVNNEPSRGPNVFLRGRVVDGHSQIGPHQRWSTGTLYDLIEVSGAQANVGAHNRGASGSGHGHSGAAMVFWNSQAPRFLVENPPTAQNWVIGARGKAVDPKDYLGTPPGIYDRHGAIAQLGDPAGNPGHSLFVAQQADRARYATRGGARRSYLGGTYLPSPGEPRLIVAIGREPGKVMSEGVVRFAARRDGTNPASLAINGEPLPGDGIVMDRDGEIITGTAVVPAGMLRRLENAPTIAVSGAGLRLLWVEIEVDVVPVQAPVQPARPAPLREPAVIQ